MKKLYSLLLCIVLIFIFIFPSLAFSIYGNVTPTTSQIVILTEAMINDDNFNSREPWVAARTSEYEYTIYYNIDFDESEANYYKYSAIGSGYQNVWNLTSGNTSNFSMPNTFNYTVVGNVEGSLYSELYNNYKSNYYRNFFIIFIFFILAYFIFRIRKKELTI